MTPGSAPEPRARSSAPPRESQPGRGPLAVVRPASSAVDEFSSESSAAHKAGAKIEAEAERVQPSTLRDQSRWTFVNVNVKWVSALLVTGVVAGLLWTLGVPAWRARSSAQLTIESSPSGAEVVVEDRVRGTTPLQLQMPSGTSKVVVRAAGSERVLSVTLNAGDVVRQLVELAPARADTGGTLEVTSEPSQVPLLIDGVAVGNSPLMATTLAAGEHVLSARFASGTVQRRIRVEAGRRTSLHVVTPTSTGSTGWTGSTGDNVAGWLNVETTLPLRILEDGRLVGTSDLSRVMLPVGTHRLRFVNEETGFETDRTVTVSAGQPTVIPIQAPTSTLSINARPWAEVFVDGERVGETPIGNLTRPIGRHEITLRHPELGERRQTVTLTLGAPARVSVDFQSRAQ